MSYTHQKVMWSSCKVNSYDEAIAQSRNGTCIVNQYGDIVRKEAVTIIARKQPHEEVTTIDVGKEVLTKNIYYVDPKIEPNALSISKYDLLDNELIVNVYKMCDHYNKVKMIRFITV